MGNEVFTSTYTKNELISASMAVNSGQYTRLGSYQVTAGEKISVGAGMLSGMDNAIGRIYAKFLNSDATPLEVPGKVRLSIYSPQDRPIMIVKEFRTEDLNTNASDKTKQLPLPEHDVWIREDQKLVLEFLPDSTGYISKTNTTLLMSVTVGIV